MGRLLGGEDLIGVSKEEIDPKMWFLVGEGSEGQGKVVGRVGRGRGST